MARRLGATQRKLFPRKICGFLCMVRAFPLWLCTVWAGVAAQGGANLAAATVSRVGSGWDSGSPWVVLLGRTWVVNICKEVAVILGALLAHLGEAAPARAEVTLGGQMPLGSGAVG